MPNTCYDQQNISLKLLRIDSDITVFYDWRALNVYINISTFLSIFTPLFSLSSSHNCYSNYFVVKPFFIFCFEIKQTQNMSVFSLCLFLHCTIQQLDSMVPFKCLLTMLCNRLLKAANEIEWEK